MWICFCWQDCGMEAVGTSVLEQFTALPCKLGGGGEAALCSWWQSLLLSCCLQLRPSPFIHPPRLAAAAAAVPWGFTSAGTSGSKGWRWMMGVQQQLPPSWNFNSDKHEWQKSIQSANRNEGMNQAMTKSKEETKKRGGGWNLLVPKNPWAAKTLAE